MRMKIQHRYQPQRRILLRKKPNSHQQSHTLSNNHVRKKLNEVQVENELLRTSGNKSFFSNSPSTPPFTDTPPAIVESSEIHINKKHTPSNIQSSFTKEKVKNSLFLKPKAYVKDSLSKSNSSFEGKNTITLNKRNNIGVSINIVNSVNRMKY